MGRAGIRQGLINAATERLESNDDSNGSQHDDNELQAVDVMGLGTAHAADCVATPGNIKPEFLLGTVCATIDP